MTLKWGHFLALELIVATGSSVSLLLEHVYKPYFSELPLEQSDVRLVTNSKDDIPVLGCVKTSARHGEHSVPA